MDSLIVDFSKIDGTCLYCSEDSANIIRTSLPQYLEPSLRMLGTGDYHYLSLFNLEQINEDFCLVLFDNHSDDQITAFGGDILSCGSWVLHARRLPHLKQDIWINDERGAAELINSIKYPVYISIDLDVLSKNYARTDWDQGEMTLPVMINILSQINHRILGVDICGGIVPEQNPSAEDERINNHCYSQLKDYFTGI